MTDKILELRAKHLGAPAQEDLSRLAQTLRNVADRIERGETAICASESHVETYRRGLRVVKIDVLTWKFMRREDVDTD